MNVSELELKDYAKDSNYHDLGTLPSQGIPYDAKDQKIYIRPFKLAELRLLSKAVELGEVSHLIRAVDNTITMPAEHLTIGDFFYIMLWLRLHSMPKSPYVVEWKCEHTYFTHKATKTPLLYTDDTWPSVEVLKTEYLAEPCAVENTSLLHNADTQILSLDDDFILQEGFAFPRMSCYVDRSAALRDPEWKNLALAIQWLPGNTWAEKVAFADSNPEEIGAALEINRKVVHGISETVKFSCRRCRIEHKHTLELTALSFFQ